MQITQSKCSISAVQSSVYLHIQNHIVITRMMMKKMCLKSTKKDFYNNQQSKRIVNYINIINGKKNTFIVMTWSLLN